MSSTCVVTKIASFQMIGVELPQPGIADFQTMSSLVHLVGGALPGATLSPVGPRHCGQIVSGAGASEPPNIRATARTATCIGFNLRKDAATRRDSAATEQDIVRHCARGIAGFKVPRYVRLVTQWPMSATKIQKFLLAKTFTPERKFDVKAMGPAARGTGGAGRT